MNIDQSLRDRLVITFRSLGSRAATFPIAATLAGSLESVLPSSSTSGAPLVIVKPQVAAYFATAAVEIWHRGVHSFLISASLTDASPIWASVSGYYSSHYAVRGLAHLLGYFQSYRQKRVVQLALQRGAFICTFNRKHANDREHQFYWRVVKQDPHFGSDPLFTLNNSSGDASDVGHREWCNYADHIARFPTFRALDDQVLLSRVRRISQITFNDPPIPQRSKFPDIDSVQIVAYQRLVRFRQFLDEVVGGSNRFWSVHRDPSWARGVIDFQLAEQGGLGTLAARI